MTAIPDVTFDDTSNLPGDDIENTLALIEANGGVGEWEDENSSSTLTPRWLFPRFAGAEDILDADGNVDMGNMYLSRRGIGPFDTDVETIEAWLAAPRTVVGAILVEGEPGGGKTALIEAAVTRAGRELITHLCTPDDTVDSLMRVFVGEGKGEGGMPYVKGVLPHACEVGATLYMDEYFMLVDGLKVKTYECADGRRFLSGGNVDGSALEIHPDFRMILSSNPLVRGASLPEPVGSRCAGTTITVETSAEMLTALGIDESIVAAWEALGTAGLWRPQIREMRVADYWLALDPAQACSAFLPAHTPESQREAIRATVVGFLGGGDLRNDGRLVVS